MAWHVSEPSLGMCSGPSAVAHDVFLIKLVKLPYKKTGFSKEGDGFDGLHARNQFLFTNTEQSMDQIQVNSDEDKHKNTGWLARGFEQRGLFCLSRILQLASYTLHPTTRTRHKTQHYSKLTRSRKDGQGSSRMSTTLARTSPVIRRFPCALFHPALDRLTRKVFLPVISNIFGKNTVNRIHFN